MKCPACSSQNAETSQFCAACGTALLESSAAPTREQPLDVPRAHRGVDAGHGRFSPGTILASRYRIIERVGQGGMGEVYHADDLTLDQPVALKFLPEELSRNPRALQKFRDEVRIARQISHPNVCRVYDIIDASGFQFLSMEYIKGEDLRSLLRRIGRLPADKAVEVANQLASGLAAAHDQGVLHRDLKPANVMIDDRGRAQITDFGLAAAAGTVDSGDIRSGTPAYMAPERRAGKEVTELSDVFSLGLVLYELFTGQRAKDDTTETEITPPSSLVSDLDPRVERLILQCLSTDPIDRPQSGAAVRAGLPARDELAVALARGETPAPALVADGEDYAGLSPPLAWACLVFVLASLSGHIWIAEQSRLANIVPLPKSPEVLASEAQQILVALDYATPQRDATFGFSRDTRYVDELIRQERTNTWWHPLTRGEPNVIRFWYRESPSYLVPHRTTEFFPTEHDPPLTLPGMVNIELDTQGHLRGLEAAPPTHDDPSLVETEFDWTRLFQAADLEAESFTRVDPVWLPKSYADRRAAWEGIYPNAPEIPIRIEAAAYRGRAVGFRIVEPWSEPSASMDRGWNRPSDVVPSALERTAHVGFNLALLLTLTLLARRNLKLGRGDRKLSIRIASVLACLMMLHWLLAAHHVPESSQLQIFFGGLYRSAFVFVLAALMYLALEPYARKLWPRKLVSWVRFFHGRFRDPIVGRDVLVGCVQGIGIGFLATATHVAPLWLGGIPPRPDLPFHPATLLALRGVRESLAELIQIHINITTHILYLFVALLLLRLLFRRTWAAVIIHWSLYVFVYGRRMAI